MSSGSSPLPRSVSSNPLTVVGFSGGDGLIVSHPISISGVGERGSAPKAPVTLSLRGSPGFQELCARSWGRDRWHLLTVSCYKELQLPPGSGPPPPALGTQCHAGKEPRSHAGGFAASTVVDREVTVAPAQPHHRLLRDQPPHPRQGPPG